MDEYAERSPTRVYSRRAVFRLAAAWQIVGAPSLARVSRLHMSLSTHHPQNLQWLPFSIPDGRHIVMRASINRLPTEIMLDSGAGDFVLSSSFARQLGLAASGQAMARGVTGNVLGSVVQNPIVQIGHVTIRPSVTIALDMTALSAIAGRPIVAIMGHDLFEHYVVDIDFLSFRIAMSDSSQATDGIAMRQLPVVRHGSGNFGIPVSVEGHAPVQALFDLGSDTPLYVSPDYASELDLLRNRRHSTSMSAGVEGTELNAIAVASKLSIGGFDVRGVPLEIPVKWTKPFPAVVGLPVLQRFRLSVAIGNNRIGLSPINEAIQGPFRKDRSGIGAMRSGNALRILYVAPNSPAASVGLRVGDAIVAINGRRLDDAYFSTRPHEGSKPPGTVLHLTKSDGSVVDLRLADYY